MRPENKRMQEFLAGHGIDASVYFIWDGSLKGNWRFSRPYREHVRWTQELQDKLNDLGFVDFDGKPLSQYSGNGGLFMVFVRGHNELLEERS